MTSIVFRRSVALVTAMAGLFACGGAPAYTLPVPKGLWQAWETAWPVRLGAARKRYPAGEPPCSDLDSCKSECDHDRAASCFTLARAYETGEWGPKEPVLSEPLFGAVCIFAESADHGLKQGYNPEGVNLSALCCAHELQMRVEKRKPVCSEDAATCRYRTAERALGCENACSSKYPGACTGAALIELESEEPSFTAAGRLRAGCDWGDQAACAIRKALPSDWLAESDRKSEASSAEAARKGESSGGAIAHLAAQNEALVDGMKQRAAETERQRAAAAADPKPKAASVWDTYEPTVLKPGTTHQNICFTNQTTHVERCADQ